MLKFTLKSTACLLALADFTGCSAFETSYFVEEEPAVSPYALASLEPGFYEQPFSLVAADSVGLATFGHEIAQWGEMPADALLTVHVKQVDKPKRGLRL